MNEEQAEAAARGIRERLDHVIPGVVVGFIGYVSYITPDGGRSWMTLTLPDQDPHMTRGMAERHLDIIRYDDDIDPDEEDMDL